MDNAFNIVFMGTPEFAVPALNALHQSEHTVSLVVTQPDRPKGRGRKIVSPPVKREAVRLGYDVTQPESIKTETVYRRLKKLKPDFLVVVAFGGILSDELLSLPRIGALNIHPSLLPKYRGPAPIQHALINDEKETGVTIMMLDSGLDAGDILMSGQTAISPDDTSETLHDSLSRRGAELLVLTLDQFKTHTIKRIPQDHSKATYAPLLKKKDGLIDWAMPAEKLVAFVRGMTPWPGAHTFINGKRHKIFKVVPAKANEDAAPGVVLSGFQDELRVATGKGAVSILEIQGASGKRLPIKDFLKGCKVPPGTVFQAEETNNPSDHAV